MTEASTDATTVHFPDLHYYLDGQKVPNHHPTRTGAEIKQHSGVPADYALFLETEGDDPDRQIPDAESVSLVHHRPRHFFAVPPGQFGAV